MTTTSRADGTRRGSLVPVLVFAPYYPPAFRGGGPIRTLDAMTKAAPARFEVSVVTRTTDLGVSRPMDVPRDVWTTREGTRVRYSSLGSAAGLTRALLAARRCRAELLYVNSYFDAVTSVLPQLLARVGFFGRSTLLVAPRGEFGRGALSSKALKKRAWMRAFRALGMHRRVIWHASTDLEAEDIRRAWGAEARVVVRENDTLLPKGSRAPELPAEGADPRPRLVSLGRVVPLKGVHVALEALARVRARVRYDVYGPLEDPTYRARCLSLIEALPENVEVRLLGDLPHDRVLDVLGGYDGLVLPTAGENFGHVIAEALSVSCPVLCTDTTPWSRSLRAGGGRVVHDRSAKAWTDALEEHLREVLSSRLLVRQRAGEAYDQWKGNAPQPHVFELAHEVAPVVRRRSVER